MIQTIHKIFFSYQRYRYALLLFVFFVIFLAQTFGQSSLPLSPILESYNKCKIETNPDVFTSIKPYEISSINTDSANFKVKIINDSSKTCNKTDSLPPCKQLINIKSKSFYVGFAPQFVGQATYHLNHKEILYNSGLGFHVDGFITKKFEFAGDYLSMNTNFPAYIDSIIAKNNVIPGYGYAYGTEDGYCYHASRMIASFRPNKHFLFQAGKDKHFFGDGYRSLLLSDNAAPYPFFKISSKIWHIQYINLFAQFTEVMNSGGNRAKFRNKYGAFHYLSWNITPWLNASFFETIIWQHKDSTGVRGIEVNYLNPVIFYRPVEFSIGSPDNSLMGLNISVKPFKPLKLYGQLILDEFSLEHIKNKDGWWANKQGFQAGGKWVNVFGFKNLWLQGELNWVRPFTYSHYTPLQNYGHYYQPLAHPLGANFEEINGSIGYTYKKWHILARLTYAKFGKNIGNLNYGNNIYLPYHTYAQEFGNYILQGELNELSYQNLQATYLIIPSWNLVAEIGVMGRMHKNDITTNNNLYLYASIKASFLKQYLDY